MLGVRLWAAEGNGDKDNGEGGSCVHSPLSPFRDRDKLPLKQMTLGPGSFTKDAPDFGMNVQIDRQTDTSI